MSSSHRGRKRALPNNSPQQDSNVPNSKRRCNGDQKQTPLSRRPENINSRALSLNNNSYRSETSNKAQYINNNSYRNSSPANDRLRKIRESLNNPKLDPVLCETIGWKPPALKSPPSSKRGNTNQTSSLSNASLGDITILPAQEQRPAQITNSPLSSSTVTPIQRQNSQLVQDRLQKRLSLISNNKSPASTVGHNVTPNSSSNSQPTERSVKSQRKIIVANRKLPQQKATSSAVVEERLNKQNLPAVVTPNKRLQEIEPPTVTSTPYRKLTDKTTELPNTNSFDDFIGEMEWTSIDEDEAVVNTTQLRLSQEFDGVPQTTLQHMLASNTSHNSHNPQNSHPTTATTRDLYIVIDTNIFLSALLTIRTLLTVRLPNGRSPILFVPWLVIQELDYFKDGRGGTAELRVCARRAITFINECLSGEGGNLRGQLVSDALEEKTLSKEPDDGILSCCFQVQERNNEVVLLSNDVNLCNKSLIHSIRATNPKNILKSIGGTVIETDKNLISIKQKVSLFLSFIVDKELRNAYGVAYDHMEIKPPPWSLLYVLDLMKKYWSSVFFNLLQKQCLKSVDDLFALVKQHEFSGFKSKQEENRLVDCCFSVCVFLKKSYGKYEKKIDIMVQEIKKLRS